MSFLNLKIDSATGTLEFDNGSKIQPHLQKDLFLQLFPNKKLEHRTGAPGYENYSFGDHVLFANQKMSLSFHFRRQQFYQISMSLVDGPTAKKGYDSGQGDMIREKNQLNRMIEKELSVKPHSESVAGSSYQFPWGAVYSSINLQSVYVSLGIHYKSNFDQKQLQKILDDEQVPTSSYALFTSAKVGQIAIQRVQEGFQVFEQKEKNVQDGVVTFGDEAEAYFHFLFRLGKS